MPNKPILDLGAVATASSGGPPLVTAAEVVRAVDKLIKDHLKIEVVNPGDRFMQELRADSLDVVELVMRAEEDFRIEISDDEAEKIITVSDAYELVDRKVNRRG